MGRPKASCTTVEPITLENSGHALDNAVVLRQIFGELARSGSLEDLKNARLVTNSGNWQDELLRVWRREAVLVLEDQGDEPPQPGKRLANFLDELDDSDSPYLFKAVPYERMKLQNMKVCQEVDSPVENIWNEVGSSVKHLTLQNVKLDIPATRDLLLLLKAKFPNLETLRLDHVKQPSLRKLFKKGLPSPGHEVTLDKVTKLELGSRRKVRLKFGNLPNLQEVKLFGKRSLLDLAKGPTSVILGVKKIDLLGHDLDDQVSAISNRLHFPELEHLAVKSTEKFAVSFINAHFGSLGTLELFRSVLDDSPAANLIKTEFSVLTTLRLWGAVMKDLSFLRFTPNLKVLHWDLYGYEKESEMREEITFVFEHYDFTGTMINDDLISNACDTDRLMEGVELSKLEYCHLGCKLSTEKIRTLANWMPHLRSFNAVLDSRGFREVCKQWKRLESLSCLFGSDIRDKDIAPLQGINGLMDLKGLRSFSFYPECNSSTLSDACVTEGFLQMAQLTKLHIFVSAKFSETSEQLLHERIPDVKIYRHYNSYENLDCCKLTEYEKLIFEEGDSDLDSDDEFFWIDSSEESE